MSYEYQRLVHALLFGLPYFGSALRAGQGDLSRQQYFLPTLKSALDSKGAGPLSLLEVGSWAGASTVTWAKALEALACGGIVTCIDSWRPYFDPSLDADEIYVEMNRAAEHGDILKLFLHNIRASNVERYVTYHQADSVQALKEFPDRSFDLIYIDGSHHYNVVKSDLVQSARLIADGGVVCGDDLELQRSQITPEEHARLLTTGRDCEFAHSANSDYHPGVTAAVAEVFGEVSAWNGFWAMRKIGGGWEKVSLELDGVSLPLHLMADLRTAQPQLLEEGYKGFNLVRYDLVYGIAQLDGDFDLALALPAGYRPFFSGAKVEDVKAQIDRRHPELIEMGYKGFNLIRFDRIYGLAQYDHFDPVQAAEGKATGLVHGATITEVKSKIDMLRPRLLEEGYKGFNLVLYDRVYAIAQFEGPTDLMDRISKGPRPFFQGPTVAFVKAEINSQQPTLIEEGYRGHNLIQYDRVYGIPQEKGTFDVAQAIAAGYHPKFYGAGTAEVKAQIDAHLAAQKPAQAKSASTG